MFTFDGPAMSKLYGGRADYVARIDKEIDRMVREGWVLAEDADLMRLRP
jgi:hypothetical protein